MALILLVILLCGVARAMPTPADECDSLREENIQLGTENANLRLEIFRLKGENYKLRQQNTQLLADQGNCTAFAENIDSISTDLRSIQEELRPLSRHFKLNNTIEEQALPDRALSERLNSFMDEMKHHFTSAQNNQSANCTTIKPTRNCEEAAKGRVGVFQIEIPDSQLAPFPVYCDTDNWLVILRRVDGTVNFQRNWADYKKGFGELAGNFIMGLEQLHQITKSQCHELKVVLEDFENNVQSALYDRFGIDDESNAYALTPLGKHSGTLSDSLGYHRAMKFSTPDRDNDEWKDGSCAKERKSGWWYKECATSRLTNQYSLRGGCNSVSWDEHPRDCKTYKSAKLLIRPVQC